MVPKLHKKGTSFRRAAAYVLHDKGQATTANRVVWAETQNLASRNPETAWRVMAATAMNQVRLKAAAGIKTTGRKSNDHVLHFTLSWHTDEATGLTREEMMRAARGALAALQADDRQALIVAHNDEPQPHVHVLVNRVSSTDGRILSSSNEKLALSRWAEQYERDRGRVLCHERVVNNAARSRGQFVRGRRDKSRHMVERPAINDNRPAAAGLRDEQRHKDAAIALKQRQNRVREQQARTNLLAEYRERVSTIRASTKRAIAFACQQVCDRFIADMVAQQHRQDVELQQFKEREQTFLGRMTNRLKSVSVGLFIRGDGRQPVLSNGFRSIASTGARIEQLKKRQAVEQRRTLRQQRKTEAVEIRRLQLAEKEERQQARDAFKLARADLLLHERMDQAVIRASWRERRRDRLRTLDTFERENAAPGTSVDLTEQSRAAFRERRGQARSPRGPRHDRGDDQGGREREE